MTHVAETGTPIAVPGRQLRTGDYFFLDVRFDASQASLKAGDTFIIALPEQFRNRDYGNSVADVFKPLTVNGVDVGTCTLLMRSITCACNDTITGEAVVLPGQGLPEGTTCTVSEDVTADHRDGYSLTVPEPQQVQIEAGAVKLLTFTNDCKAAIGTFQLEKTVTGADHFQERRLRVQLHL